MQYDPIKRSLGKVFNSTPFLRIVFYKLLDVLLLRTWHIHRELKVWKKTAPKNAHILDAGSGFGQYSYHMSGFNPSYAILGVDVKSEQVEECNQFFKKIGRPQVTFRVDDLTTYSTKETYDLVLCVDVMEHIEEDVTVLTNYCKSLKKGGSLIISTPSDQGGSDVHEGSGESFIDEHVRDGYGVQDITEKAKRAGFSEVVVKYSYGTPGKISWRLSMKYPMQLLHMSQFFFVLLPFYYALVMPFALLLNAWDSHSTHPTGTGLIVVAKK